MWLQPEPVQEEWGSFLNVYRLLRVRHVYKNPNLVVRLDSKTVDLEHTNLRQPGMKTVESAEAFVK